MGRSPSTDRRRHAEWKGRFAEHLCAIYLGLKGYRILHRRFKSQVGEIDLIAKRGNVLVFLEVKSRKSVRDALYAVTPKQRARIERAASAYRAKYTYLADCQCRFDVMVVKNGWLPVHIRQAW